MASKAAMRTGRAASTSLSHGWTFTGSRIAIGIPTSGLGTLQPEQDTPDVLRDYAAARGVRPGWLFLTGAPADIRLVRYRLGFFDIDPAVDADNATHTGAVRIGNDVYARWSMAAALAAPAQIVAAINHVDRRMVTTAPGR